MNIYSPVISGSLTVTGSTNFLGNVVMSGSLTFLSGSLTGTASNSDLLSGTGSVGFTTTGSFATMSGSVSSRVSQIETVYATTGSNSFRATQSITGSLTVTGQIIAQTLNVQQVTSSIVYSSGSNTFGCDINSRQTFTGSFYQTGSVANFSNCLIVGGNATFTNSTSTTGGTQPTSNGLHSYFNSNVAYIDSLQSGVAWRDLSIGGNDVILRAGGIERMRINSTGNIGICNTNPQSPLSFANSISNKIDFYNDGAGNRYTAQVNSGELRFYTTAINDTISLYANNIAGLVAKNGKISIAHANPADQLDIMGSLRIRCNTADFTAVCNSLVIDYVNVCVFGTSPMARYYSIGCTGISAGHTFTIGPPASPVNALTINGNGMIGINTDNFGTATTGAALILRPTSTNAGQTAIVLQDYRKCSRWAINGQSGANDATLTIYNTPSNTNDYTPAFTIGQNGQVTKPQNAAFFATINTSTNVGVGGAVIQFNCVLYNASGCYNGSTSTFTAPTSGLYQFNFTFLNQNVQNTTGGHAYLSTSSGVGTYYFTRYGCNAGISSTGYGSYVPMHGAIAVYLPTGARACVVAFWDTDGAYTHNSNVWANFSGYLVG